MLQENYCITRPRPDLALQKCLKYNLSCGKAKEMLGTIKKSEAKYAEASVRYESAWKLSKTDSTGFRLAFNYIK